MQCRPLLENILEITYRYQIFLVSSVHDVGVRAPLLWIADNLYYPMLKQTQERLNGRKSRLNEDVAATAQLLALANRLPDLDKEISAKKSQLEHLNAGLMRKTIHSRQIGKIEDALRPLEAELSKAEAVQGARDPKQRRKFARDLEKLRLSAAQIDAALESSTRETQRIETDRRHRLWRIE